MNYIGANPRGIEKKLSHLAKAEPAQGSGVLNQKETKKLWLINFGQKKLKSQAYNKIIFFEK